MRRVARAVLPWAIVLAIVLVGLEVGLRLMPSLIPVGWLQYFAEPARTEIASRLDLPNRALLREQPRGDGGPPLMLFKPHARVANRSPDVEQTGPVTLDRNGFCNPDDGINDQARVDIVAIGDSFTFCFSVDPADGWAAELAQLTGRSVLNLGQRETGLYEYLELLRDYGLAKHPGTVLLTIFEGNDLTDTASYQRFLAGEVGKKQAKKQRHLLDGVLGWSYAWNAIANGIDAARSSIRGTRNQTRYSVALPDRTVDFGGVPVQADQARDLAAGRVGLSVLDAPLASFAGLARDSGFRAVVVYAPDAATVYDEAARFNDPSLGTLLQGLSRQLRAHVAEQCQRLGLAFVDLTPALQSAARKPGTPLLYGPANHHYTKAGNRIVAETLAGFLSTPVAPPASPGTATP